jgi:hypothetical protein
LVIAVVGAVVLARRPAVSEREEAEREQAAREQAEGRAEDRGVSL